MAKFNVKKAVREKIFVKIALMAPSGGGKTYGALRLATGMAEELEKVNGKKAKILMGNTEQKRGYYYANEFDYDIVDLEAPHHPENYVDLIHYAVEEGYDILILDSSSHEWEGKGGCLELHSQAGGRYQDWSKITPRHNKFIEAIADSPIHIIATMRGKDQYVMNQEGNKTKVEKVGVGAKQREGFEYEFTCTFLIDQKTSTSEAQKDNTHIFENEGAVLLTENHGKRIIQWANSGNAEYTPVKRGTPIISKEDKEQLEKIISQIDTMAKDKVVAQQLDKVKLFTQIEEIAGTQNYKKISNLEIAKQVLDIVEKYEG